MHAVAGGSIELVLLTGRGTDTTLSHQFPYFQIVIHIEDAVPLIRACIESNISAALVDGGCDRAFGSKDTLNALVAVFVRAQHNNLFRTSTKAGDPLYYCGDISTIANIGCQTQTSLHVGLIQYANWLWSLSDD